MRKMPPAEKIHEALSAIADGRISMEENAASIVSSNYTKKYTVKFDGNEYASNDSGTYWQKYPGYPVIAVLILQGKLPGPEPLFPYFKGIDWNGLNKKHKNNYAEAAAEALAKMEEKGADLDAINKAVSEIYDKLASLKITVKRNSEKPQALKGNSP